MHRPSETRLRFFGLALFGLVVVADVGYLLLVRGLDLENHPLLTYPIEPDVDDVLGSIATATVGTVLTWLRPRNPIGWLVTVAGLSLALCTAGQAYGARALVLDDRLPFGALVLALTAGLWVVSVFVPVTLLVVRYPTGTLSGRWPARFERVALTGLVVHYVGYSMTREAVTDVVRDTSSVLTFQPVGIPLLIGGAAIVLIAAVLIIGEAAVRIRRRPGPERSALLLLLASTVTAALVIFFGPTERFGTVAYAAVLVAMAVGVLRHGALGIEVTLLTGDRNDPFAMLNRLGVPMGEAIDDQTLGSVLARLRDALGVEGIGIAGPAGAQVGTLPAEPLEVPLTFGGNLLGTMRVGPRVGRSAWTGADRRIAEAVAPLIAAVLHAVRIAEELRLEKERVVSATQAERGRLRQELHDGLGPALTGIGLGLDALAPTVPGEGAEMVSRLRAEVSSSLEETRRIIDDLRPAALDGADLVEALRRRTDQVRDAGLLEVSLEAPSVLPSLPPPVTAAAFRIAEEAITNVVRHAHASRCTVRIALDDRLVVEVRDDGVGWTGPRPGGVGTASMTERAERLGGTLLIERAEPGTRVRAELPVGAP
ncbi:GAF domain-containing sensor histidine kinase [Nocardioides humilatus]|uniref:GAF domain-containing sensor histidine kinase n=1 Tax=Nocardioides humilatus TaxID=2607660 RepID=A0A5B1LB61_9ACTN|nr:GAF domain-containing sensor histidine kinase [Nocardioides humilatus]KAA1417010.1 GAF domain-containing sensor histidine kinase [Nocardioides humilatus]